MDLRKAKILRLLFIFSLSIFCLSCSVIGQTKPNESYSGDYPDSLKKLFEKNNFFATELSKLPEIQDGISTKDVQAIETILKIYENNPDAFEKAFIEMYKVGIPEIRRYNSPLQALYWLAEEDRIEQATSFIANDFDLKTLLKLSWNFNDRRWQDPYVVIDRLNSPELIDYYERTRFIYHYEYGHGEDFSDVIYVFKHNKGHCAQITAFTIHCLKRAGYKAQRKVIDHPKYRSPRGNNHRVCLFEVEGRKFIMDNGRPTPHGIVPEEKYNISQNTYLFFNNFSYEAAWSEFH